VFAVIYSRQLFHVKSLQVNNVFQDINGHLVSRFTRRSLLLELGFKAIQTFKNVKNTGGAGYRVQCTGTDTGTDTDTDTGTGTGGAEPPKLS